MVAVVTATFSSTSAEGLRQRGLAEEEVEQLITINRQRALSD